MKLLLTSAGITNPTIAGSILELAGKPAKDIAVAFVPTAANPIAGDKEWLIENLAEFTAQHYKSVDVVDIAWPRELWLPRLEAADLLCFGGGSEQYLAQVMQSSGLAPLLPGLLETRVYMGISAGSMVMGRFLSHDLMKIVYPEEVYEELAAPLGLVDLLYIPHLNSSFFTHVREETLESLKARFAYPLYACDDQSALKVIDGYVERIGEGNTLVFEH